MERFKSPRVEYLQKMYLEVGKMLNDNGLNSDNCSSGCVKCKACSMLQFVENRKDLSNTNTINRIENQEALRILVWKLRV